MFDDLPDPVSEFVSFHLKNKITDDPNRITPEEQDQIDKMVEKVSNNLLNDVGELGIALAFVVVAEQLAEVDDFPREYDPEITKKDIFDRYDKKNTKTLTILHNDEQYGIRSVVGQDNDNIDARDVFRYELRRTDFPSSPGHHCGNWENYEEHLETAFKLSRVGRYKIIKQLFNVGLKELNEKHYESREPALPNPFVELVQRYDRSHPKENGGLTFEAIAYGYVKAEWSHLSLLADKVRTGAKSQNRYGDVDGFYGPDLIVSVEVKDKKITTSNIRSELGQTQNVAEDTGGITIAMVREITGDARDELESSGVKVLTDRDLLANMEFWDYHKQNRSIQAMLHYLTNIEEDEGAVQRLLSFIKTVDSNNKALDHLDKKNKDILDYNKE